MNEIRYGGRVFNENNEYKAYIKILVILLFITMVTVFLFVIIEGLLGQSIHFLSRTSLSFQIIV